MFCEKRNERIGAFSHSPSPALFVSIKQVQLVSITSVFLQHSSVAVAKEKQTISDFRGKPFADENFSKEIEVQ